MLAAEFPVANDWITRTRPMIDRHLDVLLSSGRPSPVTDAMRYSVLESGKRIRPLLTLAVAEFFGSKPAGLVQVACAVELIHAASLVLDDLPCMDNDSERRNRPTTHAVYGQDVSILAAISLLMQSYCILASHDEVSQDVRLKLIQLLCETIGAEGLSLGQYIDLSAKGQIPSAAMISNIHHLKTGILFLAAARAGCLVCQASIAQEEKIVTFATHLGLAFQLMDDLHDVGEQGLNLAARIGISSAEKQFRDHLRRALNAVEGESNSAVLTDFVQAVFRQG